MEVSVIRINNWRLSTYIGLIKKVVTVNDYSTIILQRKTEIKDLKIKTSKQKVLATKNTKSKNSPVTVLQ
jgi:uncharacterized membrane protein